MDIKTNESTTPLETGSTNNSRAESSAASKKKEYSKPTVPVLKLVASWTSIGPRSPKTVFGANLSKAAQKVKMEGNLKITSLDGEENSRDPRIHNSYSIEIPLGTNPDADAMSYMMAWDRVYQGKQATSKWNEKYEEFMLNRNNWYRRMGLPIPEGRNRPILTQDQKASYNDAMTSHGFGYWQIQMSYIHPDRKAVRSRVYKQLKKPDLESKKSDLISARKSITDKVKIQTKSAGSV